MALRGTQLEKRCLLPGLPDDIGVRCLARVSLSDRLNVSAVCKSWRDVLQEEIFWDVRDESSISEEVLLLGEFNSSSRCHEWYSLYLSAQRWLKLPAMPDDGRYNTFDSAVRATFDKKLFIIGGWCRRRSANGISSLTATSLVSYFDMKVWQWKVAAPLNVARSQLHCQVAIIRNELYICGGLTSWTTIDEAYTYTVEVYNPGTRKWRLVFDMKPPTRPACGVAMDGKLYIASITSKPSIVYNSQKDEWTEMSDTINLTWCKKGVELDGKWYVQESRQEHGRKWETVIFLYDPSKESWEDLIRCPGLGETVDEKRIIHRRHGRSCDGYYLSRKLVAVFGKLCIVLQDSLCNGSKFEIVDLTGRIVFSRSFLLGPAGEFAGLSQLVFCERVLL